MQSIHKHQSLISGSYSALKTIAKSHDKNNIGAQFAVANEKQTVHRSWHLHFLDSKLVKEEPARLPITTAMRATSDQVSCMPNSWHFSCSACSRKWQTSLNMRTCCSLSAADENEADTGSAALNCASTSCSCLDPTHTHHAKQATTTTNLSVPTSLEIRSERAAERQHAPSLRPPGRPVRNLSTTDVAGRLIFGWLVKSDGWEWRKMATRMDAR